jgi:2-polyprenyl-3-methyl-5-hydroxy-6-metoxy-1,4-benzoquinol methylase
MFTQDIPEEDSIGKFYQSADYISHSDTQQGLINQLYHRVRKKTLASKAKLVKKETGLLKGNILDVGCGTGAFLHTMQQEGWGITGLEPDPMARKNAHDLNGIDPLPSSEIFTLPTDRFDAISLWHVLEHVHQLHEYIARLKLLLKENGRLFIAVPNYTSYDAASYKSYWAAYDVPRHLYHFSPKSMDSLMKMYGMQVVRKKPMWFDSFYVSMLTEQNKKGKGNMVMAILKGAISNINALFNKDKCSSLIYIIRKNE